MTNLITKTHNQLLDLRSLDRTVSSFEFERAWEVATEQQRLDAERLCSKVDNKGLRQWVKKRLHMDLESKTYVELRETARKHHILYYSRLSKQQLIQSLEECTTWNKNKSGKELSKN